MKKIKNYKSIVYHCSKIRNKINDIYWKRMSNIDKMFYLSFKKNKKSFKVLRRMIYYQGGYPKPESPSKLHDLLNQFVSVIKYYKLLGNESEILDYLKDKGVELEVVKARGSLEKELKVDEDFKILFKEAFGEKEKIPKTNKEILNMLVTEANFVQSKICKLADIIKLNYAPQVKEKFNIKKSIFVKTVAIQAKKNNSKSIEKDVDEKHHEAESIEKSISIFKEK